MEKFRCFLCSILLGLSVWQIFPACGEDPNNQPDPAFEMRAEGVFQQILSPFCTGRSLNDCPSSQAHDLKEEIKNELKNGVSEESILESVFSKYGEKYRAVPKAEGFGLVAWVGPLVFFILGAILVIFRIAVLSRRA